jgi:hypothetical protein
VAARPDRRLAARGPAGSDLGVLPPHEPRIFRADLAEGAAGRLSFQPHADHAADRLVRDGLRLGAGG